MSRRRAIKELDMENLAADYAEEALLVTLDYETQLLARRVPYLRAEVYLVRRG